MQNSAIVIRVSGSSWNYTLLHWQHWVNIWGDSSLAFRLWKRCADWLFLATTLTTQSGARLILSPNFHINLSVSELYIPSIGPHIFLQQNRQIDRGNIFFKSLTDTWMWKWGLRPHNSFSGNICFEFSVLCLCSVSCCRMWTVWMIIVPNLRWRTFRDWTIRATDVQRMGSSPRGKWSTSVLTLTSQTQSKLLPFIYITSPAPFKLVNVIKCLPLLSVQCTVTKK